MIPDLPRDVVALLNGGPPSTSLVLSRGLHYGDGVFRTLLRFEGRWLDFDRHYVKLVQDCRAVDLDPPHVGQLQAELEAMGGGRATPQIGKVILSRSGGGRGYAPQGRIPDRLLLRYPAPQFAASNYEQGIAAFRSPVTVAAQPLLAGVKHLNRLENVLASRHWPAGMQEALMATAGGELVCGSKSNLFWAEGQKLFTPRLRLCGVAGVMRGKLLDLARSQGIACEQVEAPFERLLAASEAFVCNSVIGLWPLRSVDGHSLGAGVGPITRQLRLALEHPVLAEGGAEVAFASTPSGSLI